MFGGLLRPGISLGREDLRPRLPSWRRYELRTQLKAGAIARAEPMTREQCDYLIDKAHATGADSAGDLTFHLKGSREEIIQGILERSAAWNMPMTRAKAERLTDRAIRDIRRRKWPGIAFAALVIVVMLVVAIVAMAEITKATDGFTTAPSASPNGASAALISGITATATATIRKPAGGNSSPALP